MAYGKKNGVCSAMREELPCILILKDAVSFSHDCSKKSEAEEKDVDFEMNGPLASGNVQLIAKCKDCGHCHSEIISLEDALSIRKFCVENGVHTPERFQGLDCYLCKKGELQWQCYYFPKAVLNACETYYWEEEKDRKLIARIVFPEWF